MRTAHTRLWQRMTGAALALLAAAGAAGAAGTASAPAPGPAAAENGLAVTVLGIQASKQDAEHIDPDLQPIAEELRRWNYNTFRLAVRDTHSAPLGKPVEVALVEDYALRIEPQKDTADTVRLTLTWLRYEKGEDGKRKARALLAMPMTLRKGKYFLSGGWKLKDGALIGAVAVH